MGAAPFTQGELFDVCRLRGPSDARVRGTSKLACKFGSAQLRAPYFVSLEVDLVFSNSLKKHTEYKQLNKM